MLVAGSERVIQVSDPSRAKVVDCIERLIVEGALCCPTATDIQIPPTQSRVLVRKRVTNPIWL